MPTESLPLRDIHLPLPVGIWPLATGWWFLIAALIAVIAIVLLLIQRHRRPTALKQALAEVDRLFGTSEISNVQRNQEISLILKKLAVTTYPREDVAGLSGQEWIKWVRSQLEGGTLSAQLMDFLKLGPYSSKENVIQDQDVFRTEIHALLIAVGSSKVSLISKWLEHLPFLKSKKTT
jgi:Domain of unknown function (DUF4381)